MDLGNFSGLAAGIGIFGLILEMIKEIGIVILIVQSIRLINYVIKNKCFSQTYKNSEELDLDQDLSTKSKENIDEYDRDEIK